MKDFKDPSSSQSRPPALTLVVPAFNEGNRIGEFLKDLSQAWTEAKFKWALIVVDDGSLDTESDKMRESVKAFANKNIDVTVQYEKLAFNQGKGAAIQKGFELSHSDFVGFMDADGSTSCESALLLADRMINDPTTWDSVIGSRKKTSYTKIERHWKRHLFGRVFSGLINSVFSLSFYDTQCGCKFYRKKSIIPLLSLITDQRWTWDTQLLLLQNDLHHKILEEAISWKEVSGSKINLIRDTIRMVDALSQYFQRYRLSKNWIVSTQEDVRAPDKATSKKAA